ncbi:MAG: LacI family transcriptional regulator [Clostridia bacterium]|nr:LacI family transcriptional regulator [Clostridia bacterium]NCC42410.1 LacI family transcriptional regulator [Clostridia bacterium]
MAKKKPTSMDVAREAGVSQATVSMVLNKKYNVSFSKETIQQVTAAAEKLGYHLPGQRIRKSGKVRKLLVVFCPTLTNPYYVMLLQGIEAVAKDYGYGVFVCNTQRDLKIEENYLRMMREVQPLGIIYACNPSFGKQVEELSQEIPVVVISNRDDEFEIDAVAINNHKPGILMARHLLELGHKDVAFITPPLTARQHQRQKRVEGFLMEFGKHGLAERVQVRSSEDAADTVIPSIESEYRMGYDLTISLIKEMEKESKPITAIAALNDMMAFGAMDALMEKQYRIPGDMSVVGCDNTLFSRFHTIGLTTIEHFVPQKGRDACDIILRKIESQKNFRKGDEPTSIYHIEYEPKIIIRGSTGYPAADKKRKNKR